MQNSSGSSIYTYKPDGLRLSKTVNGVTTTNIWEGSDISLELGSNGAVSNRYIRGNGLINSDKNGWYLFNGHGDVVQLADNTGAVTKEYFYDSFGNEKNSDPNDTNPFRYCGEYFDKETGNIYLRARYYDPEIARFLTQDTVRGESTDPLSLNLYTYVSNNPILNIDPTGHIEEGEQEMYESGKMAPAAYTYLMKLTYQWYLADSQKLKDYWHGLAVNLRNHDYKSTGGVDKTVDRNIKFMNNKPDRGKLTKEEHYFRNQLNIEFTWNDLGKLQSRLPKDLQWSKLEWYKTLFHKNKDITNQKWVSNDGHFEVVYNGDHILQSENNNATDMGTYNYYSPKSDATNHSTYDMNPYYLWNNTPQGYHRYEIL